MPMWRSGAKPASTGGTATAALPPGGLGRSLAPRSRGQGMGARLKYCARPAPSHTTLTTLGLSRFRPRWPAGVRQCPCWLAGAGPAPQHGIDQSGCHQPGSSPCTLTTMSSSAKPSCSQASARRSLPLGWSLRVSSAAPRHVQRRPARCAHRLRPPRCAARRCAGPAGLRAPPWARLPNRPKVCRAGGSKPCVPESTR